MTLTNKQLDQLKMALDKLRLMSLEFANEVSQKFAELSDHPDLVTMPDARIDIWLSHCENLRHFVEACRVKRKVAGITNEKWGGA